MPNHKSAIKRARQNVKRRARNMAVRSRARTSVKAVRSAINAGDKDTALATLKATTSILDKAASKGILHPNNAARRISRLTTQVNAIS